MKINYKLITLLCIGAFLWYMPLDTGLDQKSWHLLVIFLITISGIVINALDMGGLAFFSLSIAILTNTIPLKDALSGFSTTTTWLIIAAFFIARTLVSTGLGARIAYLLISKFGSSTIGLSYSLICAEFLLSPMIPSTTARGGGIIFPIANSLASIYSNLKTPMPRTARFIIALCFHTNVVTCAIFLTAMAGNSLMSELASTIDISLTWLAWATFAIVPGLLNLLMLPIVVGMVLKPEKSATKAIPEEAKKALKKMGKTTRAELIMLFTFIFMLFLWITGETLLPPPFNFNSTVTALLGFSILLFTGVANWKDCVGDRSVWETVMWFAILLMMATKLADYGVVKWIQSNLEVLVGTSSNYGVIIVVILIFFFVHYFFASVTAHATVMYVTFTLLLISLGLPPLVAAALLGSLANLSGGLTHYGINTAPIYFSANLFTVREWWKLGFIVSTVNLILWSIVGYLWLSIIGWL